MARSDYGPGRRRMPTLAWLLDWAAGVLIGILALMVGAGILSLLIGPGVERIEAFRTMSAIAWPIGAALGVWLSIGRPLRAGELALGTVASAFGVGVALIPFMIGLDSGLAQTGAALLALVVGPACARLVIAKLRARAS